jgi:hypothetical protein
MFLTAVKNADFHKKGHKYEMHEQLNTPNAIERSPFAANSNETCL